MQDNAPVHNAHLVQDWLRIWADNEDVTLVRWPPYSPDLNPIENIWKLLKERICDRYPELIAYPESDEALDRLQAAAEEVWYDFEDELFEKLILSMRRRMQAVIDNNGWYTKY